MLWHARDGRAICLATQFPAIEVAEVMRGQVRLVGLPPVDLGPEVDWLANPHGNRSWALNLHALRWAGRLVSSYERTGERDHLDRAIALVDAWIRENPRGGRCVSEWAWAEHAVALRAPPAGSRVRSLWHFDPSLRVLSAGDGEVLLGDGDFRVRLASTGPLTVGRTPCPPATCEPPRPCP